MARFVKRREPLAPKVPSKLLLVLALVCIALLLVDLTGLRYGYFSYEDSFGGWALTALGGAIAVLGLAALLRPLLSRRADLYGRDDE